MVQLENGSEKGDIVLADPSKPFTAILSAAQRLVERLGQSHSAAVRLLETTQSCYDKATEIQRAVLVLNKPANFGFLQEPCMAGQLDVVAMVATPEQVAIIEAAASAAANPTEGIAIRVRLINRPEYEAALYAAYRLCQETTLQDEEEVRLFRLALLLSVITVSLRQDPIPVLSVAMTRWMRVFRTYRKSSADEDAFIASERIDTIVLAAFLSGVSCHLYETVFSPASDELAERLRATKKAAVALTKELKEDEDLKLVETTTTGLLQAEPNQYLTQRAFNRAAPKN